MGISHTRAMATVVVATFAVLLLTGCGDGSGGEPDAQAADGTVEAQGEKAVTIADGTAPGSSSDAAAEAARMIAEGEADAVIIELPGITLEELTTTDDPYADVRESLLASGVPEETVDRYIDALRDGDTDAVDRLYSEMIAGSLNDLEDSLSDLSRMYGGKDLGQQQLRDLRQDLQDRNRP